MTSENHVEVIKIRNKAETIHGLCKKIKTDTKYRLHARSIFLFTRRDQHFLLERKIT